MGIQNPDRFLIQPYYTPFFIKIQVFLAKSVIFVDYDNIYVNNVMLTCRYLEHLFLPFSIEMTTSCAFGIFTVLNIDSAFYPAFFTR